MTTRPVPVFPLVSIDMIIPDDKAEDPVDKARQSISDVEAQYRKGVITDGERYNKIIDIWTHATEETSNVMFSYT